MLPDSKSALITSLIKAKQSFDAIKKDKKNPHYGNRYATLDSVLESVEKHLHDNGLVMSQTLFSENNTLYLVTSLMHESGEKLESTYPIPIDSNPQKMGISITYARRYSVCAILSVTADEDDDGNGAVDFSAKKPTGTKTTTKSSSPW